MHMDRRGYDQTWRRSFDGGGEILLARLLSVSYFNSQRVVHCPQRHCNTGSMRGSHGASSFNDACCQKEILPP